MKSLRSKTNCESLITIYFLCKFLSVSRGRNNCCFPKVDNKSTFMLGLIKSLTHRLKAFIVQFNS